MSDTISADDMLVDKTKTVMEQSLREQKRRKTFLWKTESYGTADDKNNRINREIGTLVFLLIHSTYQQSKSFPRYPIHSILQDLSLSYQLPVE